jgi:hypothetical protein
VLPDGSNLFEIAERVPLGRDVARPNPGRFTGHSASRARVPPPRPNPPEPLRGETETDRGPNRVIFKCGRCKSVWAKDYVRVVFSRPHQQPGMFRGDFRTVIKRRVEHFRVERDPATGREVEKRPYDDNRCPKCKVNDSVSWNAVAGTYNPKEKCGAKCHNAKGPNCDCSCKGENHGKNYTG